MEAHDGKWVYQSCPSSIAKCPHCMNHIFHIGCLVVGVAGAVSTNAGMQPRSSMGIYWGYMNKKNKVRPVIGDHQTVQVAELKACLEALNQMITLHATWQIRPPRKNPACHPLHTLIIKSDSEYMVKGITEWLSKWKENGWKNCKGQPVANMDLWLLIESALKQLELAMVVRFWLVSRDLNRFANHLAMSIL
ncbi:hypothetical protein N7462_006261 [Penicillium macrosclerotiorum]|uniref:uncharacterized protein n=1 Tax=Penicillium macrosclerotiorum TaxID=303699 RepID=UPI0025477171|nr:uncharacterized protein N7462_006261 [Penicillium macrosclerotiorum]KAJ5683096.1 hypothetical protein N7462_006261 [Penicillium macrosclerotiorum]